jgi:hypothetical protein
VKRKTATKQHSPKDLLIQKGVLKKQGESLEKQKRWSTNTVIYELKSKPADSEKVNKWSTWREAAEWPGLAQEIRSSSARGCY